MKIFLVGGGSGGPIVPLLAVAEALRKLRPAAKFYFVGENKAFEEKYLQGVNFPVQHLTIPAGKWRRYFSLWNFLDVFRIFFGFCKSLWLIKKYQPDVIFGAGSFVQVPMAWAGFLMRVPVVVHQQDVDLLLSTRLAAPVASKVTVGFAISSKELPEFSGLFKKIKKSKIVLTGNPVRQDILGGRAVEAREIFGLNKDYPTVLVLGGGTGAERLNEVLLEAFPTLAKYVQIIHSTGRVLGKVKLPEHSHYHPYEFLGPELKHAYAVADLVISRGGMATITELARLGKSAIIVPLPQSPQEDNVRLLAFFKCVVGVFEEFLTAELLVDLVRKILWSREIEQTLRLNIKKLMPPDADQRIAKLLLEIYNQREKR